MVDIQRTVLYGLLFLLIAGSATAAGVWISASPPEARLNDIAYYHYQAGEYEAAETSYLEALTENPDYETARYNLAILYFRQGLYEQAIPQFERLLEQNGNNPSYHFDYAVTIVEQMRETGYWDREVLERAIYHYETAERLQPGFPHAAENAVFLQKPLADLESIGI